MEFFFLLIAICLPINDAYVLLQVRKGDNQSDVDALIHKVVPTGRFQKIVDTARKQFESYKTYNPKKNHMDGLESIVIAIDSGATPDVNPGRPTAIDKIIKKLSEILQVGALSVIPKYRSQMEKYHIKPEIVHFRSGKPSVMFEVNTKAVMRSIQDFLSSKQFRDYADRVVHKAAIIYRTVKDEIMVQ